MKYLNIIFSTTILLSSSAYANWIRGVEISSIKVAGDTAKYTIEIDQPLATSCKDSNTLSVEPQGGLLNELGFAAIRADIMQAFTRGYKMDFYINETAEDCMVTRTVRRPKALTKFVKPASAIQGIEDVVSPEKQIANQAARQLATAVKNQVKTAVKPKTVVAPKPVAKKPTYVSREQKLRAECATLWYARWDGDNDKCIYDYNKIEQAGIRMGTGNEK